MSQATVISHTGDCTIFESEEVKQLLLTYVEVGGTVTFDFTHAGKVDSAGLQLIIAAHRTGACALRGLSARTRDDLRRLGWDPEDKGLR